MKLSIITSVYDRLDCLRNCIASVRALTFKDYEHVIVSDHPPVEIANQIKFLVESRNDSHIVYYNLPERFNDNGRGPAEWGLQNSTGEYFSFLSDDNGYLPGRFEPLIQMLDDDSELVFVYTACHYSFSGFNNCLRWPIPEVNKVDAGQPVFRRAPFVKHFNNQLGYRCGDGDGRMIQDMSYVGPWKFVDDPTFVFRLKDFPQFIVKDPADG